MADHPRPPPGKDQVKRQALSETIDELEALLHAREQRATAPPAAAPPADADIPVLYDRVIHIDKSLFAGARAARPAPPPAADREAAEPQAPLSDQIKHILTQELHAVIDDLRASVATQIHQALAASQQTETSETSTETMAPTDSRSSADTETTANPGAAPNAGDTLPKTYDPRGIEQRWYAQWEDSGYFAPDPQRTTSYAIALPPPNVTGSLHMGHGFQHTLMDALIRYHRMSGDATLWQCGTDHAGIATQMVVERMLAGKGVKRTDIGRERFVNAVWAWKEQSGGRITQQLRRMGSSMDWGRERFTLDEGLSRAVTEVFVALYEEGLIYRGKRLVNWDPVLHTAISDLEVVAEEEQGQLWHIRYPLADDSGFLVVATTRPETMLGDTAVAVHPEDARYQHLIGRQIRLPLTDRVVPVIADDYVDPEFGSGCVKITPAHDFNDYEVGKRHALPAINIFTIDATINDNGPPAYRGLDRYEARRRIVDDLKLQNLLERELEHKLMVPRGDRSHAVVEPLLTDQWYVRTAPLAAPAITAVEEGRIRFVPDNWAKTYFDWMHNIEDWCISRQLWWGHRIPAWYDDAGAVYVGVDEQDARDRGGLSADTRLRQDPDVLDTWFSSALWPFSTLGWPDETPELKRFYPTDVLVTAFDIIFFWVARMIMMGLKVMGDVPFREVYIHGLVRDADGNKMSKSKGNILDPLDLVDGIGIDELVAKRTSGLMRPDDAPRIEQATRRQFPDGISGHGTDALRFTFASLATQGRDIRFDLGRIEGYRNFCNKLWNAARFVLMMTAPHAEDSRSGESALGLPERWIRTRMQQVITAVRAGFDQYRFDLAAQAIYEFVWDEFCDWYLELAKVDLNDPDRNPALQRGTRRVLVDMLETLLRLLHPIMPFITEELWQRVAPIAGREGASIMCQPFPRPVNARHDAASLETFAWVREVVLGIRRIRAEMNIEPRRQLAVLYSGDDARERGWLQAHERYIRALGRIDTIAEVDAAAAPQAATALAGNMTFLIPLADLIDPAAERQRLDKELDRLRKELSRIVGKLSNENFLGKAPAGIVQKERAKRDDLVQAIERLKQQRQRIEDL